MEAQGFLLKRNIILQDNQSAMLMEANSKASCSKISRHLNIRYFYVTDAVERKEVEIAYCPTEVMLADFFTKPFQVNLFKKFRVVILGNVPVSSICHIEDKSSKECVEVHMKYHQFSDGNL